MKNKLLSQLYESCKKWKTLVLLGAMLLIGMNSAWATDLYVRGDRNSWGTSEKMTGTSSPWTFTAYWDSNSAFKIGTDNWSISCGSATISAFGTKYNMTNDGGSNNMSFPSIPGGIYTITVTLESETYKIKVDKVVEEGTTEYDIEDNTYIYFNVGNASSTYTTSSILLGKSDGSKDYAMSGKISGTQLFYNKMARWDDFKTFLFINANNWGNKWSGDKVTKRLGSVTNTKTHNTNLSSSYYHMFTVASGDDNAALSYTKESTYGTLLNKTQTVQVRVSEDNGENYSNADFASWPGSITVARTYLSSATASSSPSATAMTSATTSAALTSSITFTGANTTEYTFAGWSNSSTGPDGNASKTYTVTGAVTKYAFYKRKQYTVSYGVYGSANGSISLNSGSDVTSSSSSNLNHGTSISFTATPDDGFEVEGWYGTSGCDSEPLQVGGESYDAGTLTAGTTVYVKFADLAGDVHSIGYTTQSTGWSYDADAKPSSASVGDEVTFIVIPTAGYTVNVGSNDVVLSGPNASNEYTFTMPDNNVSISVSATENIRSITISANPAGTGTFTVNSVSGTSASVGVATTASIVATPHTGYTWSSWTTTNCSVSPTNNKSTTLSGDGSTGSGTLRGNFTLIPCALRKYDSGRNGSQQGADMAMSYDLTLNAYYYDVTASKPYYFRFYYNNSKEYYTDWASGGTTTGKEIITNGSKVDCDKKDYGDKPAMYFNGLASSPIRIWFDYENKKVWITETTYAVTVNNGSHGTVSPNGSQNAGKNTGVSLTAEADDGYHFTSWSKGGTVANISLSSTTTNPTTLTATGTGGTVTANYEANTYRVQFHRNGGEGDVVYQDFTYDEAQELTANTYTRTGYNFAGWALSSGGSVTYADGAEVSNLIATNNATFHLYAKWTAKQSTITLDQTGYGTAGSTTTRTGTYGLAMPAITGANTLPVAQTGYKFMGYYDNLSPLGTKYYNADGTSAHLWDKDTNDATTLYAYYQPAAVTSIAVSPNVVAQGVTITATPTISPIPEGTTMICWRVLHSNTNPLGVQPTFRQGPDNSVLFAAPETSASYKIEAKLYTGSTCGEGTLLSTTTADFQVAGLHKVTVRYKCGDEVISDPTTLEGIRPLDWSEEIAAPSIFGYIFNGWTAGDGVSLTDDDGSTTKTSTDKDHPNIKIKANYDGYLTASYTKVDYIYFKNNMGWSNVYVFFYTSDKYWDDIEHGSGAKKDHEFKNGDDDHHKPYYDEKHGALTRLGETDIWYFDAGAIGCADWTNIVFNANDHHNYDWFSATEVVRRGDFKRKTPLFVPADKTKYSPTLKNESANYYNKGYWVNYLGENTGYTLEVYNEAGSSLLRTVKFTSDDHLMPMVATLDLEAGKTYKFQLKRDGNTDGDVYYGNGSTMTYANRYGQGTPWAFTSGTGKCGLTTTAAGDYTFHLTYSQNGSGEYDLRIAVEHPIKNGDYRLIYTDETRSFMEDAVKKYRFKPSAIVSKENDGSDIVSFFVRSGETPVLRIQKATVAADGSTTWAEYPNPATPTNQITDAIASAISSGGTKVYNFNLSMDGSGNLSVVSAEPYTGNYYIRVDVANSKWDNWTSDPDHLMTYSEYSIEHGGYSHYYCHWVKTDDKPNVKFCIANDYSPCISDTLTRETNTGTWANINHHIDASGNVTTNANVRFMWNQADNTISRAYVDGAQGTGANNFLYILSEDGKIKKSSGSALDNNKVNFSDNENWIYEANLKVQPNAEIKLLSNWGTSNTITQYFKGSSSETDKLIGGSGTDWYDIRVVYDFKTNRLMSSWVPSDANITTDNQINADVMFIREHQGDIAQLTFGDKGKISEIKTAYGVLQLNKWTLANKSKDGGHAALLDLASIYERSLYWISFPFRVKLSEVLAFGAYGTHWAIQRYDGADRAARGHFLENGSFWKWMDRNTEYLEPNQGYLLAVDLDLLGEESDVWGPDSRSSQLEIYFPSYGTMPDITNADVEQTITPHVCEINRAATEGLPDTGNPRTSYNRTIFDSHWNIMSVPTYVNTADVTFANSTWTSTVGPNFLYTWNPDDNTITATSASGYKYHAMHAYMVQYGGTVTWSASSGSPASIVARRTYAEKPSKVEFRLELQQNEKMIDRTYVALSSDENVSSEFRFGEDMTKEFNANKANIYTKIDYLGVAGNTLPMSDQTTVVPVGVEIKTDGDYTFTMPDGTEGIGVTLVDNETGVRTNLGLTDYVVTLSKGDYVDRFALEISPIMHTPTGIDNIGGDVHDGIRKVMVDGILYIVKEGVVFDAHGNRVK